MRKLFIAGASGATGKVLVAQARAAGADLVEHYRPQRGAPPGANHPSVLELADAASLEGAMQGCTTVLQLIGTMRNRFAAGDTYETSDIGTTRQLVAAAQAVGVDHLVLLSSVGAGRPVGAYLQAKAAAEALVTQSGIAYSIFRPSALVGNERKVPGAGLFGAATKALGLHALRPISLEDLSAAMLVTALEHAPLGVILEGRSLWAQVAHAASTR